MKPFSERIKSFPADQFIDWLCLACVDVRQVRTEEDAQDEINNIRDAVTERLSALEARVKELDRLKAQDPNPFMYAIMNPEGNAHFDDMCVASDIGSLEEAIDYLDDDERSKYKIIPVYAGLHPVIPEGWQLVPVEPTQKMVDAHMNGVVSGGFQCGYRAMISAAPTP